MIILAYLIATLLLLFSLKMFKTHFRSVPTYFKWLGTNPFDWMAIRGLLFPLNLLASIYVCLRTYFDPSTFWLEITGLFLGITIVLHILMFYWTYKMLKPAYEEYQREEEKREVKLQMPK